MPAGHTRHEDSFPLGAEAVLGSCTQETPLRLWMPVDFIYIICLNLDTL